jgi:hypothetical protein
MFYKPQIGEMSSFYLVGYRQPDGSIRLGKETGTSLPNFPDEVELDGIVWTLENIKLNQK